MKQYKVLRPMINAPVGTILKENPARSLENSDSDWIVGYDFIDKAIDQKFIEPYTPEPKRWRTIYGGVFWYIDDCGIVVFSTDFYDNNSKILYNSGNCFKSQATAELVAKARKLELEWLHASKLPNDGITVTVARAMEEARKAVLEDDSNE